MTSLSTLTALSPLEGRYYNKVDGLRPFFSEYALIRHRIRVEIEWLKALSLEPAITELPPFSADTLAELAAAVEGFSEGDADAVKAIEARTNHDVKAVEYWLKERFSGNPEVTAAGVFSDLLRLCAALGARL